MNKRIFILIALFVVLLWLVSPPSAYSNQPNLPDIPLGSGFTYQGFLKDASGAPIHSTCDFIFQLFNAASSGSQIGADSAVGGVSVNYGYFSALVNSSGNFGDQPFNNGDARWLQIWVRCSGEPGYTLLAPRQAISMTLPTHDHWGQTWTSVYGTGLTLNGGAMGLLVETEYSGVYAHSTGVDGMPLYGYASATTGFTYGVYGNTNSPDGKSVAGWSFSSIGSSYGVWGRSDSSAGYGVFGKATAPSGFTYGVYGETHSDSGYGVYGIANSIGGSTYGVYGQSDSSEGTGVSGYATTSTGFTIGVYGQSNSTDGHAVMGAAYATSGAAKGVYGWSHSTNGYGVYGNVDSTTGNTRGVYGESASVAGVGVYGYASASSGLNYGVYGKTESTVQGYAGYFEGDVGTTQNLYVTGNVFKSGGSFRIDHPLDPQNQFLYHSFVESPDMLNIYNGIVTLDGDGEAWVELPNWFEALNQDFRYQLTPIGASMPDLYIAEKIQDNRFKISGGLPGMEVSWLVTGVRHDPWAEAHRIPVEQPKPPDQQGLYLHPELYGQPAEQGIGYEPAPE